MVRKHEEEEEEYEEEEEIDVTPKKRVRKLPKETKGLETPPSKEVMEVEINLTLLNQKLNYIISKLE